jgi:hypothetical protein
MRSGCIDSMSELNKRKEKVGRKILTFRAALPNKLLRLLVACKIAVDQARNIVAIFFLFLKESIVVTFVFDFDIVIDDGRDLVLDRIGFLQRDKFHLAFGVRLLIGRCAQALAARHGKLEDRAAFRANDRVFVQIEKFRAALLALMLIAKLGFRHRLAPERSLQPAFASLTNARGKADIQSISSANRRDARPSSEFSASSGAYSSPAKGHNRLQALPLVSRNARVKWKLRPSPLDDEIVIRNYLSDSTPTLDRPTLLPFVNPPKAPLIYFQHLRHGASVPPPFGHFFFDSFIFRRLPCWATGNTGFASDEHVLPLMSQADYGGKARILSALEPNRRSSDLPETMILASRRSCLIKRGPRRYRGRLKALPGASGIMAIFPAIVGAATQDGRRRNGGGACHDHRN